jgi:hypothetical protein
MIRLRAAAMVWVAAAALALPALAGDLPDPEIRDLRVAEAGGDLRVSYRVEGGFRPELIEELQSGMTVVFRHRIDLLTKRAVPLMPLRLLARTVVEASVRYDSLTRQYHLERRSVREEPEELRGPATEAELAATPSLGEVEVWMSTVSEATVPAPPSQDGPRKPRIRVRAEMGRDYRLLIFPFTHAAEAEQALGL